MNESMCAMCSTGPMLGGVMVHAWIDLVGFVISLVIFFQIKGGKLSWPFLVIALNEIVFTAMMFAGTPMWILSTVRSILILVMIVWFLNIFKIRKPENFVNKHSKK